MLDNSVRVAVFGLRGEIDLDTAKALERELLGFAATTQWDTDLVVDCTLLDSIDSAGISTLIRVHLTLKDLGRRLIVTNLSPPCRHTLEVSGALDVIGDAPRV